MLGCHLFVPNRCTSTSVLPECTLVQGERTLYPTVCPVGPQLGSRSKLQGAHPLGRSQEALGCRAGREVPTRGWMT